MAQCVPAPACKAALAQASRRWPGRRTSSDGICSSLTHQRQSPNSDHDYGLAFDLSHDPAKGVDTYDLAERLRRVGDRRIKYVISNSRIWNPSISPNWRSYSGSNPHTQHLHVSVLAKYRDDTSDWWARLFAPSTEPEGEVELTADEREAVLTANHFVKVIWPQYAAKIDEVHQHLEVLMKGATLGNGAVIPPVPRVIFDLAEKHGIDV